MSAVNIIAGIGFTAMLGGAIIAWWHGQRHLFSFLFVACIATLAVAVTNSRVGQHGGQTVATKAAVPHPAVPASGVLAGASTVFPMRAPTVKEVTGSTTPPSAPEPYAGGP